jgi:hypothetical protein
LHFFAAYPTIYVGIIYYESTNPRTRYVGEAELEPKVRRGMVVLIRYLYSGFIPRGRVAAYAASRAGYETLNTNQQARREWQVKEFP